MSGERESGDIDGEVIDLTTSVLAAAESCMPRSQERSKREKWWNNELWLTRIHVKRARRGL